ncbi:hypothetical protein MPH_04680 [Macrophomina phaseolina MS6]|uniref:Uncharacterized protein n=1 Tax=Macrophomina phaseolina (strain MS6) TaxID=1126212 RepID=K2R6K8_MACPH|nr:hypothetical protein MPH_04680 [Macrophomina phaseolina MS6]
MWRNGASNVALRAGKGNGHLEAWEKGLGRPAELAGKVGGENSPAHPDPRSALVLQETNMAELDFRWDSCSPVHARYSCSTEGLIHRTGIFQQVPSQWRICGETNFNAALLALEASISRFSVGSPEMCHGGILLQGRLVASESAATASSLIEHAMAGRETEMTVKLMTGPTGGMVSWKAMGGAAGAIVLVVAVVLVPVHVLVFVLSSTR